MVDLFKAVNVLDDPEARMTAWARQPLTQSCSRTDQRTCDGSWTEAALGITQHVNCGWRLYSGHRALSVTEYP